MAKIERNAISKMKFMDETPLVVRLPRSQIRPDPENRKERDPNTTKGIAKTMKVRQLQPVAVWEVPGEPDYQLIYGEGRWLAAGLNEEETGEEQFLDCIIIENVTLSDVKAMQIIENLQRSDPSEMQYALAFKSLLDLGQCATHEEVATATGVSAATVSVYLSVLAAPEKIVNLVSTGKATMDTARTVAAIEKTNPQAADALIEKANKTGKLKRDEAREAHAAEKKTNPAAATKPSSKTDKKPPKAGASKAEEVPATPPVAQGKEEGQQSESDSNAIVVPAVCVLVNVFGSSSDTALFHANVAKHGKATLANDLVHVESDRAWIRFGEGTANDQLMSVLCIDLEIIKIERRG